MTGQPCSPHTTGRGILSRRAEGLSWGEMGDTEQKGDARETSGASGFGCERTVSLLKEEVQTFLQKVLPWGCFCGAELSMTKFPEGEILAMPWVHQQGIHTPAFGFPLPLSWLFACFLRVLT